MEAATLAAWTPSASRTALVAFRRSASGTSSLSRRMLAALIMLTSRRPVHAAASPHCSTSLDLLLPQLLQSKQRGGYSLLEWASLASRLSPEAVDCSLLLESGEGAVAVLLYAVPSAFEA